MGLVYGNSFFATHLPGRAIWDATCELMAEWFQLRGIDPKTQRVDKAISGTLAVPWAQGSNADDGKQTRETLTVELPYSSDMLDLLVIFNRLKVQYLIVGGRAVDAYTEPDCVAKSCPIGPIGRGGRPAQPRQSRLRKRARMTHLILPESRD
jgi:hypothetical protein